MAALLAGTLTALLSVPGPGLAVPARRSNPTGTHAGSAGNGAGYLKTALSATSDGRILVTWRRPTAASKIRRFVVKVGPNRRLDVKARRYAVGPRQQSLVVSHAFGATPSSGNYTFVKVYVVRRGGAVGGSITKWIQATVGTGCPDGPTARVGTFNVRSWGRPDAGAPPRYRWAHRGPRVVTEILRSGAHVVAIQEASGLPTRAFPVRQSRWILNRLNAIDPDRSARWNDVVSDSALRGGLTGTRVFYDASKLDRVASGFRRVTDPRSPAAYATWARLRIHSSGASFVFVSSHLAQGESRSAAAVRSRQVQQVISLVRDLHSTYGEQAILGADLNSTANTKPFNTAQYALVHAGFFDSFATPRPVNARYGTTNNLHFPVRATPYRRDYLLSYGGARGSCGYVNRVYGKPSKVASDHFMQVATLPVWSS